MLIGVAVLDQAARPTLIVIRTRIFPPPHVVATPVAAQDQVLIAVAVDVVKGSAGLDRHPFIFNHQARPAVVIPSIPDHGSLAIVT